MRVANAHLADFMYDKNFMEAMERIEDLGSDVRKTRFVHSFLHSQTYNATKDASIKEGFIMSFMASYMIFRQFLDDSVGKSLICVV